MGEVIVTHPDNMDVLRGSLSRIARKLSGGRLEGIPIRASLAVPRESAIGEVEFPHDRFIEYEESDADWMLALGLAKREMRPVYYIIDWPGCPPTPPI